MILNGRQGIGVGVCRRIGEDMVFRSADYLRAVTPAVAAVLDGSEAASLLAKPVVKLAELVLNIGNATLRLPLPPGRKVGISCFHVAP